MSASSSPKSPNTHTADHEVAQPVLTPQEEKDIDVLQDQRFSYTEAMERVLGRRPQAPPSLPAHVNKLNKASGSLVLRVGEGISGAHKVGDVLMASPTAVHAVQSFDRDPLDYTADGQPIQYPQQRRLEGAALTQFQAGKALVEHALQHGVQESLFDEPTPDYSQPQRTIL